MRLPWQARGEDSELPLQEATVRFLLGELRFRMPGREPTKKEKNGSIAEHVRSVRRPFQQPNRAAFTPEEVALLPGTRSYPELSGELFRATNVLPQPSHPNFRDKSPSAGQLGQRTQLKWISFSVQ